MIKYIIYLGLILIALSLMPSVASITLELTGNINDAYAHLDHTNTDYLTGWNTSIADNLYNTTDLYVGQLNSTGSGGAFVWYRTYLYFDTSSIGNNVIDSAYLQLTKKQNLTQHAEWRVVMQNSSNNTYPHYPPTVNDFNKSFYTGSYGSKKYDTYFLNTPVNITLNTAGINIINSTGITKICLRSDREINGTQPGAATSREYAVFHSADSATDAYKPKLFITYIFDEEIKVQVNATTNITETNASLNGYIQYNPLGTTYTAGFWYGLTTPVTEDNAIANVTAATGLSKGDAFEYNITGLSPGTHYYVKAWAFNATKWNSSATEDEDDFWTKPNEPTALETESISDTQIDLSWTKGTGANTTYIIRKKGSYPTDKTDGDLIFNNTGSTYSDTGLDPASEYFYRAWSIDGGAPQFSDNYVNAYNNTKPQEPQTASARLVVGTTDINVTWTKGTNATNTLVRRKTFDYPSTIIDGNAIYNDTGSYVVNDSSDTAWYYSLWSIATVNSSLVYSVVAYTEIGGLNINCYDENTTTPIALWDIFITNYIGTETYTNESATNTHTIDINDVPKGSKVKIVINATGYKSRTYYLTITSTTWTTLNVYLPDENATEYYLLNVQDQYDEPIQDAYMQIKRNINGTFTLISSSYTDSDGYMFIYLIPDIELLIEINKSGYVDSFNHYAPDPIVYTKSFRMYLENLTVYPNATGDIIIVNATMNTNNTIYICYNDKATGTTDTHFFIYEYYNKTLTLKFTQNDTSTNQLCFYATVTNTSRMHVIYLDLNHSDLGYVQEYKTYIQPLRSDRYTTNWLLNRLQDVFGTSDQIKPEGFIIYLPALIVLFAFLALNAPGFGVLGSGIYILWVTSYVIFQNAETFVILGTVLLLFGVMALVTKQRDKK
jgi:hypothetical protein